ncbi:hypothetical protein DPMN_119776 [Dreissena polymorpha]|uniref:Uncharacterized protein n=1 Tax=Dreissena polymorpha TaxID=45954 RepID=A0A9D4JRK1_DREPO|nr:hypothetical protein DPMN_119776 [Dreissena polymorpha]
MQNSATDCKTTLSLRNTTTTGVCTKTVSDIVNTLSKVPVKTIDVVGDTRSFGQKATAGD